MAPIQHSTSQLPFMPALSVLRFLFLFCSGNVFFSLFQRSAYCKRGRLLSSKQLIVFVFLLTRSLRRFLCVTFLCVEREPHHECRSMLFKQHTWKSHQNLGMPKAGSCPQIPYHCLRCGLVIKLICWLNGHTRRVGIPFSLSSNRIVIAWVHGLSCIISIRKAANIIDADDLTHR